MTGTYDDLFESVGAVPLERDVLVAEGPEAAAYLHGQLSQDIEGLAVGESAWSFLLEPTGKVESHLRVSRVGDERFVLDVEPGFGEPTQVSLDRFKLRTKVQFTPVSWRGMGLRGPGAATVEVEGAVVDAAIGWPGGGRDLLGPELDVSGVAYLSHDLAEVARIEAGMPRQGADFDAGAIPQETGWVPVSVAFTKGCYRGQELVERISARGAERRVLRRFRAPDQVSAGATLSIDGEAVGELTSVAESPRSGVVALGWVRGAIPEGSTASAASAGMVIVGSRVDEE
ncbi:MAG: hypothetical protein AAGA99_17910 [Actinomycetota bacterium]